jgi:hypothetical protein
MATGIDISKQIAILDEGTQITPNVNQINFTGTGVTATASGNNVTVNVSGGGGGGLQGIQNIYNNFPAASSGIDAAVNASATTNLGFTSANQVVAYPFTPNKTITSSQLRINVTVSGVGLSRILIYSDLNGFPDQKLFESTDINVATSGSKNVITTFTFNAGTTYWLAYHSNISHSITGLSPASVIPLLLTNTGSNATISYFSPATFGSAPNTYVYGSASSTAVPRIMIMP